MPGMSITIGIILILQAIITYFISESRSFTALIPGIFGGLLVVLGAAAKKPEFRKHAMHAAAGVALLGVIGAFMRAIPALAKGSGLTLGVGSQLMMGVLLIIFLVLAVRSFINARRARENEPSV